MSDSTETSESFPTLPASENVAESGPIANVELAAGLEAAPARVPESAQGMWAAIRESLRGSHRDYTVGPIGRAVILLAIPMVLEMFMESLFVVADIFWVSHLGPEAAATVGLTESLLTLVYALAIGLSVGATATIARRIARGGAGDPARPDRSDRDCADRRAASAQAARVHGRIAHCDRPRIDVYAHHAGRERDRGHALHD